MSFTLSQRIQQFYDASSGLWEQTWGEHMHHGYYGPDGTQKGDRRQAQVDLIEELLRWSALSTPPQTILDVGCGIGGSTLYLAEKYGATATGITLSPVQAERATARAAAAGLSDQTQFLVADALKMPFADESFDLVWSLESGEHMPDKTQFLQECCRVLKPGGILIMVTWCHREATSPQPALTTAEQALLGNIYRIYHLPYVISLSEYAAIARSLPLNDIRTADWSQAVAPFWTDVMWSALNPQAMIGVLLAGWQTLQGAFAVFYMAQGYQQGLIRYGLLRGTKTPDVAA